MHQARTEFSRAMSEKDEDHRRKELVLEEKHSRDLARKSQSIAEEMAQQPSGEEGGTDAVEGRGLGGFRGDGRSSKVSKVNTVCKISKVRYGIGHGEEDIDVERG